MTRKTEDLASFFKALADPSRMRLLCLLARLPSPPRTRRGGSGGSLCVNALVAGLDLTQSAVSQHLKVLRQAGLVRGSREGAFVHYSLDRDALNRYMKGLQKALGAEASRS